MYFIQIRKEKELLKQMETPEEKRARRLAKKEAKERRRKEKMGWDKDYLVYYLYFIVRETRIHEHVITIQEYRYFP